MKIQPAVTGREDSCFWLFSQWSRVGHALCPIFMLWLVKIWQVSSCGKFMQHLETCLLCWSWQSFVSTCDVFNCLFPLDVQNEIQLLSGVFCYSWLVSFWLRYMSLVKVGNPISDGIIFVFHLVWYVRVEKSEAIQALLDTFKELHLEWWAWVIIVFDVCFLDLI